MGPLLASLAMIGACVLWAMAKAKEVAPVTHRARPLRGQGPLPAGWRRATATVLDVSTYDSFGQKDARPVYRILMRYTPEGGGEVVVDQTCRLADAERDLLLPDVQVPIRYDPRDPQRRFEIEFSRIPPGSDS